MEKLNIISSENVTEAEPKTAETEELNEKIVIGQTRDGKTVCDRKDSHWHKEGGLSSEIMNLALGAITTDERPFITEQVDFDGLVGYQACVEVGPEDEVVMVYREGRPGQTPMVKNREAIPSNSVTVVMKKGQYSEDEGNYILLTGYVGTKSEREPWDTSLTREDDRLKAKDFWNKHAIVYDEDLIDWNRTKAFYAMSPEEQKLELMSDKVFYEGLFVDTQALREIIPPRLDRPIRNLHVTTKFNPDGKDLNLEQLGAEAKITVIGYGNDGKNEGLLVKIKANDPVIQAACDALETPHITLSVSKDGKSQDTGNLNFEMLAKLFEINGKYGLYSQGRVIQNIDDVKKLED